MDNRRLFLILIFCFSLFMLWDAWLKHNQPPAPAAQSSVTATSPQTSAAPQTTLGGAPQVTPPGETAIESSPTVRIATDVVIAEISAVGGDITHLELVKHKETRGGETNFVLFDRAHPHVYVAQSGLIGDGMPNHKTRFTLPANQSLAAGQDTLTVRLEAEQAPAGIKVSKLLTFKRGSYEVETGYEIENESGAPISSFAYFQFTRDGKPAEGVKAMGVSTFTGPAVFTEAEKYQKLQFKDIAEGSAKFNRKASDGWIAMVQHYFVSAWLPKGGAEREFIARKVGEDLFSAGVILPDRKSVV